MKKIATIILALSLFTFAKGQEVQTWDGLQKKKNKSDLEIQNPKKAASPKTWLKRASTYYDIHTFVIAGLYKGMPATGNISAADLVVGKPMRRLTKGNEEIWEYKRKKLYFVNGKLDHWEQTQFMDKEAIKKAADALLKAIEVDTKGKVKSKSTTKDILALIKPAIINKGIQLYQEKKHKDAYKYMEKGYELMQLPAHKSDTIFKKDQISYFKGIIAFNAKQYADARSAFNESIKANYQPGSCYHYLADCHAQAGDSAKFISTVKEGFEKYPGEELLIIDLINYYMIRNQGDKAVAYIDMAIQKNPKNASYYSAKAAVYDNATDGMQKEYEKYMTEAQEQKKAAFRNRSKAALKAQAEKNRDEAIKKALNISEKMNGNFAKAEKLYEKALQIDPKFFNAAYFIGRLYYKRSAQNFLHADYLLKVYENKDFKKSGEFEALAKKQLKTSAEKFERAHKISPKDRDALEALKKIYFRLRDKANKERIEAKLAQLGDAPSKM